MSILSAVRDYVVISCMVVIVAAIGIGLFYFGPASLRSDMHSAISSTTEGTSTIPFTILTQGSTAAAIDNRANYLIPAQNDLSTLWQMVYGKSTGEPHVDFSKYEVLGVFDGSQPTTEYDVQVASVVEAGGKRIVTIRHIAPGELCTPSTKSISPFELIQVPKTTLPLTHIDEFSTTTCPGT